MTDTTTIEITTAQRRELREIAQGDESFKSVLQRLIDDYRTNGNGLDEARVREIATEVVTDRVRLEALE